MIGVCEMFVQRPGQKILTIGNPGLSVTGPRGGAGAVPWWLAGGVDPADCVGAYQAKGAASYTASKVNLANPGTYDLTTANNPTLDSTTGWYLQSSKYLDTGIVPTPTYSFVGKFTGIVPVTWKNLCGLYSTTTGRYHIAWNGSSYYISVGGNDVVSTSSATSGVFAIVNRYLYVDGVKKTATQASINKTIDLSISVGAMNVNNTWYDTNMVSYCERFALYKSIITEGQLADITAAIAAL